MHKELEENFQLRQYTADATKGQPLKLTKPVSPNLMTQKRLKVQSQFMDTEMTVDSQATGQEQGNFKALPLNKSMFKRAASLPRVEKKMKTGFDEFKLSNGNQNLGRKTLIEYQEEIERMQNAQFKAKAFDKDKFMAPRMRVAGDRRVDRSRSE